MSYAFAAFVALSAAIGLSNWRFAVYLAFVIALIRDPVRKMTPGEPLWITYIGAAVWAGIFVGCFGSSRAVRTRILKSFPGIRKSIVLLVLAILPAAGISLVLYSNGWIFAAVGLVSYLAPIPCAFVGVQLARTPRGFLRVCSFFVLVNALGLIGGLAEFLGWAWPGLGGLNNFNWVRQQHGVWVDMVGGFFRSPDVGGFYAAHVLSISLLLAIPRRKNGAPVLPWLLMVAWGAFHVFIAGRRKMMAIPIVFVACMLILAFRRKKGSFLGTIALFGTALAAVGITGWLFVSGNEELKDHTIYASTAFDDIIPKLYGHTFQGSIETVRQSGILGSGLGVATQGAHYGGQQRQTRAWQEDGVSRLFKELGVPGVLLVFLAALQLGREVIRCLGIAIPSSLENRQTLSDASLSMVVANLACFVISHQHISGDPLNAMIPLLFFGAFFGHVYYAREELQRSSPPPRPLVTNVPPLVSSAFDGTRS